MKSSLYLITIFLFGLFLRGYKVDEMPVGLYWDEASIAYNAYSILETGKDEYGNSLPFWFKAFGEYKLPVYIYWVSISMFLFGVGDFAVRIPSVLAGSLSIIGLYMLAKELFESESSFKQHSIALVSAFLFAISPWSIQFSRAGFEANVALFFLVFGFVFLLRGAREKKYWYGVSGVLLVLSLSTYNSERLFIPLMLVLTIWIYRKKFFQHAQHLFVSILVVGLVMSPLIIQQFSSVGLVRAAETTILGEQSFVETVDLLIRHYSHNFDTHYLFFHGDLNGRHSVKKLGMMYYFQIPLVLIGLYQLRKYTKSRNLFIMFWLLLAPIPAILTTPSPHALRSLHILPAWMIVSGIGSYHLITRVKLFRPKLLRKSLYFTASCIILYNFALYISEYNVGYRKDTGLDWGDGYREAVELIKQREEKFDEIFVSDQLPLVYLSYYLQIPPKELHQLQDHWEKNLPCIDKYCYFAYVTDLQQNDKNRLIVAPWWQKPDKNIPIETIYIENGDALLNIWEENASS